MKRDLMIGERWADLADQYKTSPEQAQHNAYDEFSAWADAGVNALMEGVSLSLKDLHGAGQVLWACALEDGEVLELTTELTNCRRWLAGDGEDLMDWVWRSVPHRGDLWNALMDRLDDEAHLDAVKEAA